MVFAWGSASNSYYGSITIARRSADTSLLGEPFDGAGKPRSRMCVSSAGQLVTGPGLGLPGNPSAVGDQFDRSLCASQARGEGWNILDGERPYAGV
jgi:hypothetical protein